MSTRDTPGKPLSGSEALEREAAHVSQLRGGGREFIGLALSGGGIRSATFNLGILQALAKQRMLGLFDYLSTVSGGGYIGSWLSALIGRKGISAAAEALDPGPPKEREAPPVRFLRRYSNYLAPKVGLSGDTLAAVATYLRNFLLNLLPLFLLGTAFILAMYLLFQGAAALDASALGLDPLWLVLALLVAGMAGAAMGLATTSKGPKSPDRASNCPSWMETAGQAEEKPWRQAASSPAWAWTILLPVGAAGILLALAMAHGELTDLNTPYWMVYGLCLYGLAWVVGWALWTTLASEGLRISRTGDWIMMFLGTLMAGAVGGLLVSWVEAWLKPDTYTAVALYDSWRAVAIGAPLVLLAFATAVVLHIGLLRRILSHQAREWWSRLGGLLLAACLGWLLAFGLAGLAPALLVWAHGWTLEAGGAWAVLTAAGVWLAKSPLTGGEGKRRWLEIAVRVTPYIFIAGFAILLSGGVYALLTRLGCDWCEEVQPTCLVKIMKSCPTCLETWIQTRDFELIAREVFANLATLDWHLLLACLGICLMLFLIAGWRVDINLFSLHHFYRNRLARAYLGASNYPGRESHPFTGFCPEDDMPLTCLKAQRPFHIVNTTLNLSGGEELAWQTRRAASFTFTPLFCGFEYRATRNHNEDGDGGAAAGDDKPYGGYRPSEAYLGRSGAFLGTAMSISGAAASPLAGYHTSAPLAALMTIFNVRLGQWQGNPMHDTAWRDSSPSFGSRYLLKELTASANARARFLYLSDGGHFENLGIYELARRRCRLIVAVDAGCDPRHDFDDLANAIRKCRIDLGVEIDINVDALRPRDDDSHTARHHAAGLIRYANGETGALIYVKASITGDESPDILNYKANHPAFPHDTTADQNFDEDQFESYRALGLHIGVDLFSDNTFVAILDAAKASAPQFDMEAFITLVKSMGSPT